MARTTEKIVLGIVFIIFIAFNSFFIFGTAETVPEDVQITTTITESQAKAIALKVADGTITEFKEKTANGVTYYEIEVENDVIETEMRINKNDGRILNIEQEEKDDDQDEEVPKEALQNINGVITEEEAINIALALIPGTFVSFEAERENGRLVYEVEIAAHGDTAEVEIDAATGNVLETEWGDDD